MDKSVTEAKAEVEAYVSSVIQQTGLQALYDMKPEISGGETKTQRQLVEFTTSTDAEEDDDSRDDLD